MSLLDDELKARLDAYLARRRESRVDTIAQGGHDMRYKFTIDRKPGGPYVARWTTEYGAELHSYEIPDGRSTLTPEEDKAGDLAAQEALSRRR